MTSPSLPLLFNPFSSPMSSYNFRPLHLPRLIIMSSCYGSGHLITTTFGQWPIWPGWGKNYYVKNCSPDGSAALFAVKPTFPMVWHYQPLLFTSISHEIWCYIRQVPLIFMPDLVSLSGQSDGAKNNLSCNFEFEENLSGINDPLGN